MTFCGKTYILKTPNTFALILLLTDKNSDQTVLFQHEQLRTVCVLLQDSPEPHEGFVSRIDRDSALQNLFMLCKCYMEGKLKPDFDAGMTLKRWYDPEKELWMNAVTPVHRRRRDVHAPPCN